MIAEILLFVFCFYFLFVSHAPGPEYADAAVQCECDVAPTPEAPASQSQQFSSEIELFERWVALSQTLLKQYPHQVIKSRSDRGNTILGLRFSGPLGDYLRSNACLEEFVLRNAPSPHVSNIIKRADYAEAALTYFSGPEIDVLLDYLATIA